MAIMAGTTALVARAVGSGDPEEAAQVTRASMGLCLIISFVTVFLLWIGADSIGCLVGCLYPEFTLKGKAQTSLSSSSLAKKSISMLFSPVS